jgi:CheY-like chemotaxis protein
LVAELLADTRTQTAKTAKAGTKLPQAIAGGRPRALVERAAGHKKILVVEDDLEGVDALREVLLRHGYEVDFATDVARAGELVSARHYDAVLTDVLLPSDQSNPTPKPSGAVKVIRHTHAAAKSRGQRIPVIVISGGFSGGAKASDMLDMTVSLSGSAAALTKPVEPTDLIGALEAAWA